MLFAKAQKINYAVLDRKVVSVKEENIDSLAKQLAALGSTDKEKVRVIFRWITENINYNVRIYNRNKIDPGNFYEEPDDTSAALPSLNDRVAAKVLKRKIAFCDGYSRLFSALCSRAGIRSEVIYGYARINQNSRERFGVNHSWNAVYLDSAWHLLDVTWASGFVSYANEYIRQYNDFYYLTAPADFYRDHYPEEIQWTLLDLPQLTREFNQQPFRHSGFNKYSITSYSPQKGIIDVYVGDSIRVEIKTKKEVRNFIVTETFQPDSLLFLNPI
jgi:transglutaminase/protease-like cytokinesis protein 3